MTLATVNASGQPSARMVLLKDVSQSGFIFYSNYESRKAEDIKGSGRAALLFYWDALEKQVRIEGTVTKTSRERSEVYFQSRPRSSQLSAMISPQSQVIPSRNYLEERQHKVERHYPHDLPLPEHWGGYILRPALMEFWQGRPNRLHDRFQYRLEGGQWSIERLAP